MAHLKKPLVFKSLAVELQKKINRFLQNFVVSPVSKLFSRVQYCKRFFVQIILPNAVIFAVQLIHFL